MGDVPSSDSVPFRFVTCVRCQPCPSGTCAINSRRCSGMPVRDSSDISVSRAVTCALSMPTGKADAACAGPSCSSSKRTCQPARTKAQCDGSANQACTDHGGAGWCHLCGHWHGPTGLVPCQARGACLLSRPHGVVGLKPTACQWFHASGCGGASQFSSAC